MPPVLLAKSLSNACGSVERRSCGKFYTCPNARSRKGLMARQVSTGRDWRSKCGPSTSATSVEGFHLRTSVAHRAGTSRSRWARMQRRGCERRSRSRVTSTVSAASTRARSISLSIGATVSWIARARIGSPPVIASWNSSRGGVLCQTNSGTRARSLGRGGRTNVAQRTTARAWGQRFAKRIASGPENDSAITAKGCCGS